MTADDNLLAHAEPPPFERAWADLILLSLAWGIAWSGIWGGAWMLFGDYGLLIMPAAAAMATFCLWPFRRALAALAEIVGGRNRTARSLAATVLVVLLTLCLIRLRPNSYRSENVLPFWAAWLRPRDQLYRVLILMPLWGAWAMIVAVQFCRHTHRTEEAVAAFARCGPIPAAGLMGALLAVTILYFNFLPWWQLSISGVTILAAIGGGLVLARLTGGPTRRSLLAGNVLTQIVFILAYLANTAGR